MPPERSSSLKNSHLGLMRTQHKELKTKEVTDRRRRGSPREGVARSMMLCPPRPAGGDRGSCCGGWSYRWPGRLGKMNIKGERDEAGNEAATISWHSVTYDL